MRVLVVGAAGHLGAAIVEEFSREHDVHSVGHADLDITDERAVEAAVRTAAPEAIVNCAAYNDVDGAEDDPVQAFAVNAFGVQALARGAAAASAVFVHFSTDFVFDGETDRPYSEEDRPGPRSIYGASKLVGEWFGREAPQHYVVRVQSLFGGAGPRAMRSVGKIADLIARGQEVPVFVDRVVSPTHVGEAAAATRALVTRRPPSGVYHCVNSGSCRWDELAREVAAILHKEARLKPITLETVSLRARRPRYCALSNAKLRAVGIEMSHWRDALARYLSERVG